jgi:hypothetical protein
MRSIAAVGHYGLTPWFSREFLGHHPRTSQGGFMLFVTRAYARWPKGIKVHWQPSPPNNIAIGSREIGILPQSIGRTSKKGGVNWIQGVVNTRGPILTVCIRQRRGEFLKVIEVARDGSRSPAFWYPDLDNVTWFEQKVQSTSNLERIDETRFCCVVE